MNVFRFKKYTFTEAEILYLRAVEQKKYGKYDTNALHVELWDKLGDDFSVDNLERFAIWYDHPTLLGLWYLNPKHFLLLVCDKIARELKNIITTHHGIKKIHSSQIASALDIDENDVKIGLRLLLIVGMFQGGSFNGNEFGCNEICFNKPKNMYSKIMKYKGIEIELEEFFNSYSPSPKITSKNVGNIIRNNQDFQYNAKDIWLHIKIEYEVNKPVFAKKIRFISDPDIKKIILRDVADAYVLSKLGFTKSSIILSGSVIEEILRQYLLSKGSKINSNNFYDYIEECRKNNLLKPAITNLSNAVRNFRNLVHIKEEDSRSRIIKSMATGAVSSIFSIVDQLSKNESN